jgi:site-specific DNA-methyltransferase (cytosine-N4-specific)
MIAAEATLHDSIETAVARLDWNFWRAETNYLTHGVHRYSGKFIPQIAAQAVELLTRPGDLIVDPYCGSGTTLVEAAVRGRRAIGIDMNPLAVLIASVKSTPINGAALGAFRQRLELFVHGLEPDGLFERALAARDHDDPRLNDPWYIKWFQARVLQDLVALYNEISVEPDLQLRNIGYVAFSDILRRASNAHQGYPNVMFDRRGGQRPRPGRFFLKSLRQIAEAVVSLPAAANWSAVEVREGDARALDIPNGVADAVITHPPYVASIPYAEYGALSLRWLGHDPKSIDRKLTGGLRQSRKVLERFNSDYLRMIHEAHRVTRAGGYLFTLVGNPTIRGELIDLAEITSEHARAAGFDRVAVASRAAENRRANKMGDETLLVFRRA